MPVRTLGQLDSHVMHSSVVPPSDGLGKRPHPAVVRTDEPCNDVGAQLNVLERIESVDFRACTKRLAIRFPLDAGPSQGEANGKDGQQIDESQADITISAALPEVHPLVAKENITSPIV